MNPDPKYRIIESIPGEGGAYKAQVRVKHRFLFWTWETWENLSGWQWSRKDCHGFIKEHKGEINRVIETFD